MLYKSYRDTLIIYGQDEIFKDDDQALVLSLP